MITTSMITINTATCFIIRTRKPAFKATLNTLDLNLFLKK